VKIIVNEKLAENSAGSAEKKMLAGLEKIRAKYSARIGRQADAPGRRHALRSEGNDEPIPIWPSASVEKSVEKVCGCSAPVASRRRRPRFGGGPDRWLSRKNRLRMVWRH